ncbi:uncharacterized protein P884DRAFT_260573 [Thermothelomyces heterothallicus CBS 202.75]|uniref:uncharacterized protein n=1 Tax=Thermothelomyces heterothallicus CBS 202.75 TaxID=1149848 RepID=UPI0037444F22
MDARRQQILEWICTGKHVIQTDYDKPASDRTADDATRSAHDAAPSEMSTSSSSDIPDKLIGADHDLLIPSSADIDRVFHNGRATWARFARLAEALPLHAFPAEFANLSIMLKDVPALPDNLPKRGFIIGRPLWHVPDPDHTDDTEKLEWDLQYAHGVRKFFHLSYPTPIECRVYSQPAIPGHALLTAQRGLSFLTMCWSYILSVRILELQGSKPVYSRFSLLPVSAKTFRATAGEVVLNLGASASRRLVRWLCAVLSPKPGWLADGGKFPPWAAFCAGDRPLVVVTADGPAGFVFKEPPPSSTEATELLIEFCRLYGLLKLEHKYKDQSSNLPPPIAAFLAALALPFYRNVGLQPQFPIASLGKPIPQSTKSAEHTISTVRQYVADLRYYMTLSMHPSSIGSIIWSIFWQPDVEANLVSPWLASISTVINPILESRNLYLLAKVFALRRPRVAPWWLGIFLLGDFVILDRISRYLKTLEERWGFGSMALPDITVAAWTGSPQSFLDSEPAPAGQGPKGQVSRADVLRHRYNFRLQEDAYLSWRPFGYIAKELLEPDLWPWLERGYIREYSHWVWYIKRGNDVLRDVQLGFRRDTNRFVPDVPDRLKTYSARRRAGRNSVIKLEPSKTSTLRMIDACVEDVCGDRDACILAMPGAMSHPWLKDWRGLE